MSDEIGRMDVFGVCPPEGELLSFGEVRSRVHALHTHPSAAADLLAAHYGSRLTHEQLVYLHDSLSKMSVFHLSHLLTVCGFVDGTARTLTPKQIVEDRDPQDWDPYRAFLGHRDSNSPCPPVCLFQRGPERLTGLPAYYTPEDLLYVVWDFWGERWRRASESATASLRTLSPVHNTSVLDHGLEVVNKIYSPGSPKKRHRLRLLQGLFVRAALATLETALEVSGATPEGLGAVRFVHAVLEPESRRERTVADPFSIDCMRSAQGALATLPPSLYESLHRGLLDNVARRWIHALSDVV